MADVLIGVAQVDEAELERKALASKIDSLKQHEQNQFGAAADQSPQDDSFTTQLVSKIVDNLQIVIRNIHVRFEDRSDPTRPRCFGLGIQEISGIVPEGAVLFVESNAACTFP
jgi:vacuolar protein sorting-associated protein 13A/C